MTRGKLLSTIAAAGIFTACVFLALGLKNVHSAGKSDEPAKSAPAGKDADDEKKPAGKKDADDEKAGKDEKKDEAEALPVPVATVHSGTLSEVARVTGTIQPLPNGQSKVAAQAAGRVASVVVRPGDTVRRGQLLATVSRPELANATQQAQAAVREAERELDALRADRESRAAALPISEQKAQAELSAAQSKLALLKAGSRPEEIERAEAVLATAQADLARLKAGPRTQEVAQAEAAVRDAISEREAQKKNLDRKQSLQKSGLVAVRDVERAQADLTTAEATLETRKQALSLLKAGPRPEEVRAQESRVREAQAQLRQAKAGARKEEIREAEAGVAAAQAGVDAARAARSELKSLDQKIKGAQARVDSARSLARSATVSAGRVDTRSPIDGIVTQVFVAAGDGVSEQSPIAQILNRDAFRAVLEIPAAYRASAVPGTRVEVTLPTLPGAKYEGAIRSMLPSTSAETGLVPAEVWLSDPQHRLAEGMQVNGRLLLRGRDNRLFVPTSALFVREGEQSVFVVEGGAVKERQVEVGREQGEETEILKGLKAGDRVVRDGSLALANGTKVTPQP